MRVCTALFLLWVIASPASSAELRIEPDPASAPIDLTRFGLGQGGLSERPMLEGHIEQIRQLHPQMIRLFVQEYYSLYPAHAQYTFGSLDRALDEIAATGAQPMLCLCFKPSALFPRIDERLVSPANDSEWEELIVRLVQHVNRDRKYGVTYWEIANEPDIGERGGAPYLFDPQDYVRYYTHTAAAILRADPQAKVGGPALAHYKSDIGTALVEHCAAGKATLHFFSWHVYSNDPALFRRSIQEVKAKLAGTRGAGVPTARAGKLPDPKEHNDVETVLDEWNMSLEHPVLHPAFQPAFILETTWWMQQEGLTWSAYYHLCDRFVDEPTFARILSPAGAANMARWWNDVPQYCGLYDHHGRVRPAYEAFKLLSLIRGKRWMVSGSEPELKGFAARGPSGGNVLFWNFPAEGAGRSQHVRVRLPDGLAGRVRFVRLRPESPVNNLELVRSADVSELAKVPLEVDLEPYGICWLQIGG